MCKYSNGGKKWLRNGGKKWLRNGAIIPAISPWKRHCPQISLLFISMKTRLDHQCVLFEKMTTPQKKLGKKKKKSQLFICLVHFVVSLMLAARLLIRLHQGCFLFTIIMKIVPVRENLSAVSLCLLWTRTNVVSMSSFE